MIFLACSIACSVSIAHLFKYAEQQRFSTFGLLAVNYLIGTGIALWGIRGGRGVRLPASLIGMGIVIGILFVCSYLLMILSIKILGVTIPVSLMRLSAVLPTFGSILLFAEIPRLLQLLGIAVAFLSLPLASDERIVLANWRQVMQNGFGRGLTLFFVFGVTNFMFKIQREVFPLDRPYYFLAIIFPTAFVVSVTVAAWHKSQITCTVMACGIILGVLNLFSSYFLMRALETLPGMVVYPINGIGIILVSAVTSAFLWKERLTKSNYGFIAFASVALLLIYPR
jgi:drug/metabolite transporter (DMT)-like permease